MSHDYIPDELRDELHANPNVVGTGKSEVHDLEIRVYVVDKVPESDLEPGETVPETVVIDGEEWTTDVIQSGQITPDRARHFDRPVPGGISCSHPGGTAGTLGTPQLEDEDGDTVFLTNAHVAAGENTSSGDPVLQPGPLDGGSDPEDRIGSVKEYTDVYGNGTIQSDSALVEVDDDEIMGNQLLGVGRISSLVGETSHSGTYHNYGRSSGESTGDRMARDVTIIIDYQDDGNTTTIEDIDEFTRYGEGGDSGSITGFYDGNDDFHASHLHFAGDSEDGQSFAVPLQNVFDVHGQLSLPYDGSELHHYDVFLDGDRDHYVAAGQTASVIDGLDTGQHYSIGVGRVNADGDQSKITSRLTETRS